jgi:hypothetical protein
MKDMIEETTGTIEKTLVQILNKPKSMTAPMVPTTANFKNLFLSFTLLNIILYPFSF